jgi:hypothetical protein
MGAGDYLSELCRFYVFATLAIAALGKSVATGPFVASTADLLGLSRRTARFVALSVIAAEAVIAILLLLGGDPARAGMAAALLLFLAFTSALAAALLQRRTVRCNCFGARGHTVSIHDLVRNSTLIAAAAGYLANRPPAVRPDAAEFALLLACALILLLVFAHLREIQALVRSTAAQV